MDYIPHPANTVHGCLTYPADIGFVFLELFFKNLQSEVGFEYYFYESGVVCIYTCSSCCYNEIVERFDQWLEKTK